MNDMTPEKLRELLLVGTTKSSDEVRQMISASASAWEAEVRAWKDAYAERDRAHNVLVVHIEALVRLSERHTDAASIGDVVFLKSAILSLAVDLLGEGHVRAALAAEEKKP